MKAKLALEQQAARAENDPPTQKSIIPKSVQKMARSPFTRRTKDGPPRLRVTPQHAHVNGAFNSDVITKTVDALHDDGSQDLEALVARQQAELHQLEREYEAWHDAYTQRVDATRRRHSDEQRHLLRDASREHRFLQHQNGFPSSPSRGGYPSTASPGGLVGFPGAFSVYPARILTTESTSRSVATTYRPYPPLHHLIYPENFIPGSALPLENF